VEADNGASGRQHRAHDLKPSDIAYENVTLRITDRALSSELTSIHRSPDTQAAEAIQSCSPLN